MNRSIHPENGFDTLPQDNGEEPESRLDLASILQALRKYWPLSLAICLAVTLGVTFYTLGQPKIYAATATVMFDPAPPRPLGREVEAVADLGGTDYWSNQEYYSTQLHVMKSKRVAVAVVQDLGLHRDPAFVSNAPPGGEVVPGDIDPDVAAGILLARTSVEPVKNTRLATLRYEDANPDRAQRIALAMVEVYIAKNVEDTQSSTSTAVDWLNEQVDKLKSSLDATEMDLYKFQLDKQILALDVGSQSNILRDEMMTVSTALTQARIRRVELDARTAALSKIAADDAAKIPATELMRSEVLSKLRGSYMDARAEQETLLARGKGANHPDVKEATAKLETARSALLLEIENIKGSVAHDLAVVRRQEAGLSGLIESAKQQALDVNLLGIEYARLQRTKENNEKLYDVVLERAKQGDLTRMMQVNNIRVVEAPTLPREHVRPNVQTNVAGGFGVGVLLGIAAALGLFLMDRSVKSQADIEGRLGLNFLGVLPSVGGKSGKKGRYGRYGRYGKYKGKPEPEGTPPELVIHHAPMSGTAEAARSIRTNIQFMSPDKPFRTLLVTSANPSEGKTTVACTLAIAMAQAGLRVCMVDCDLRRPRLHRIFGKSSDTGLSVALLEPETVTDELLSTEIPNLSVLAAGPIPPNPAELLQSDRFSKLLRDLQDRFDRVVIDSPPIGPVTDAAVLSTQVDGTVLVIRAGKASRDSVTEAKRALVTVGGRIVGAMLNFVDVGGGGYMGYRYSYYRKGGYYRREEEPDRSAL
jgi:capsular exopolysaccharide synthesis family protein